MNISKAMAKHFCKNNSFAIALNSVVLVRNPSVASLIIKIICSKSADQINHFTYRTFQKKSLNGIKLLEIPSYSSDRQDIHKGL